ncbi:MAG: ABC transporter permease [Desulfobulbaceae bacterium]|nr:ABC transporter permease [Candidatus Kapabacteria bacterium]MBS4001654.1 ABC transporter permease [Desulfobulbaceae bacterium]
MKTKSKIGTIIKHEYLSKIKSKGFIIGTILAPVGIIVIYGIIILVAVMSADQTTKKLAIVDYTERIGAMLVERDTSKFFLTDLKEAELNEKVLTGEIDGYLVMPKDFAEKGAATVYTSGGGGLGFVTLIERNTEDIIVNLRLDEIGADESVKALVNRGISLSTMKVTQEGAQDDYSQVFAIMGYVMGFVIYGLMFTYGAFVMRGVIEEKANRIVEVLASSVKPFEIMMGKVIGIGAVGLTQVLFWIVLMGIFVAFGGSIAAGFMGTPDMATAGAEMQDQNAMIEMLNNISISPWLIVAFLFYFLAGYFIYSTLFAAVGSAVDQESDAAQLQIPVTLPIIIPIMFIANVMSNPDGTLAVVLSLIPFFTPILMIARIAATSVPIWQIALSVVLLAATFFACLYFAAKIYRVGILMYGKKPTFKDMVKWFKLAK